MELKHKADEQIIPVGLNGLEPWDESDRQEQTTVGIKFSEKVGFELRVKQWKVAEGDSSVYNQTRSFPTTDPWPWPSLRPVHPQSQSHSDMCHCSRTPQIIAWLQINLTAV